MTLADFETEKRQPYDRTLADIRRAFEDAGIEFRPDGSVGPSANAMTDRAGTVVDVAVDPTERQQAKS